MIPILHLLKNRGKKQAFHRFTIFSFSKRHSPTSQGQCFFFCGYSHIKYYVSLNRYIENNCQQVGKSHRVLQWVVVRPPHGLPTHGGPWRVLRWIYFLLGNKKHMALPHAGDDWKKTVTVFRWHRWVGAQFSASKSPCTVLGGSSQDLFQWLGSPPFISHWSDSKLLTTARISGT